ncbi:hypothetical protein [Bradyrhizobium sp.]|uniref:hypothetical protein n=1 Tax=Bradyrhizobium sp. TaxID=376 RepID=UPI003C1DADE5
MARLEAKAEPARPDRWHSVTGDTKAECEAQRRAMIERGEAAEADGFTFRIIIRGGYQMSRGVDFAEPRGQ